MFVKRKRNIFARRFRSDVSNIVFVCKRRFVGFTLGNRYKPFAYSLNADCYKDFCIFDDFGRAMYMEFNLIEKGVFDIIYATKHQKELEYEDLKEDIDKENERYKEDLEKWKQSHTLKEL